MENEKENEIKTEEVNSEETVDTSKTEKINSEETVDISKTEETQETKAPVVDSSEFVNDSDNPNTMEESEEPKMVNAIPLPKKADGEAAQVSCAASLLMTMVFYNFISSPEALRNTYSIMPVSVEVFTFNLIPYRFAHCFLWLLNNPLFMYEVTKGCAKRVSCFSFCS